MLLRILQCRRKWWATAFLWCVALVFFLLNVCLIQRWASFICLSVCLLFVSFLLFYLSEFCRLCYALILVVFGHEVRSAPQHRNSVTRGNTMKEELENIHVKQHAGTGGQCCCLLLLFFLFTNFDCESTLLEGQQKWKKKDLRRELWWDTHVKIAHKHMSPICRRLQGERKQNIRINHEKVKRKKGEKRIKTTFLRISYTKQYIYFDRAQGKKNR